MSNQQQLKRELESMIKLEEYYYLNESYLSDDLISESMRSTLVEWMHDLCKEENKLIDVFSHSVMLFDRFMFTLTKNDRIKIDKSYLQLFATACLFISSKVKSNSQFDAFKLVEYTDNSISLNDLLESELFVLETLNWDVDSIGASDFFDHISSTQIVTDNNIDLIREKFYQETIKCSMDFSMQFVAPSQVANICLLKALSALEIKESNNKMDHLVSKFDSNTLNDSGYSESSLLSFESSPESHRKSYGRITKRTSKKIQRKNSLKMKKVLNSSFNSNSNNDVDESILFDADSFNFVSSSPLRCF